MPLRETLRRLLRGTPSPAAAPEPRPAAPTPPPAASPAPHSRGADVSEHTLALYKYDSCPFCRRVMSVIDDLGLRDRIEYRDTRTDPRWRADLVKRTGMTQVPCLLIDDEPMLESADIIDWLRQSYAR